MPDARKSSAKATGATMHTTATPQTPLLQSFRERRHLSVGTAVLERGDQKQKSFVPDGRKSFADRWFSSSHSYFDKSPRKTPLALVAG